MFDSCPIQCSHPSERCFCENSAKFCSFSKNPAKYNKYQEIPFVCITSVVCCFAPGKMNNRPRKYKISRIGMNGSSARIPVCVCTKPCGRGVLLWGRGCVHTGVGSCVGSSESPLLTHQTSNPSVFPLPVPVTRPDTVSF